MTFTWSSATFLTAHPNSARALQAALPRAPAHPPGSRPAVSGGGYGLDPPPDGGLGARAAAALQAHAGFPRLSAPETP